ncbi:hypothetical protein CQZ99_12485 [Pseudomonas poae]|uniref:Uncharacterized protein n=1 Tax=Pseudomonas poae TaxID=200451 RepID=A0A2S9ETJ0_9PSED|nr:hypothetical protein CQZ97_17015 [Pseudomonas poae]PRC19113.1 hypothetical protein CQZ99_12485 [Pseudomonas poae]
MISILKRRHIIECDFLPHSCTYTTNPDGSLMFKEFDSSTDRVDKHP